MYGSVRLVWILICNFKKKCVVCKLGSLLIFCSQGLKVYFIANDFSTLINSIWLLKIWYHCQNNIDAFISILLQNVRVIWYLTRVNFTLQKTELLWYYYTVCIHEEYPKTRSGTDNRHSPIPEWTRVDFTNELLSPTAYYSY